MSTFSSFTDIQAWQKARIATEKIYMLTETGKFQKDFGLKDQVRRLLMPGSDVCHFTMKKFIK